MTKYKGKAKGSQFKDFKTYHIRKMKKEWTKLGKYKEKITAPHVMSVACKTARIMVDLDFFLSTTVQNQARSQPPLPSPPPPFQAMLSQKKPLSK